jgi:UDP-N-acetylglucosamine 2-epimerase (non-hydrolysing)
MRVLHVVAARPNFMKVAPVFLALKRHEDMEQVFVHTGQHYDFNMSDVFFQQLKIPAPDVNLGVGSASHARQTAEIMMGLEPALVERKPDLVLVYGDVNSTLAAALVCSKLTIPVGHVEAGLRSFDRSMPEEINRLLTDQVSDLLFTPSQDGSANLASEGIAGEKVHLVGNVMIDTLVRFLSHIPPEPLPNLPPRYALLTLHRPSNVDDLTWLRELLETLRVIGRELPIIFPVHPRTRQRLSSCGLLTVESNGVRFLDPLPYLEFLSLQSGATVVITDSGGIQEETTFLQVPCLTVRENTERPITITQGTNILLGRSCERLRLELEKILSGQVKTGSVPALWDGHAAERVAKIVAHG